MTVASFLLTWSFTAVVWCFAHRLAGKHNCKNLIAVSTFTDNMLTTAQSDDELPPATMGEERLFFFLAFSSCKLKPESIVARLVRGGVRGKRASRSDNGITGWEIKTRNNQVGLSRCVSGCRPRAQRVICLMLQQQLTWFCFLMTAMLMFEIRRSRWIDGDGFNRVFNFIILVLLL